MGTQDFYIETGVPQYPYIQKVVAPYLWELEITFGLSLGRECF